MTETFTRSMWKMLDSTAADSGDSELPDAVAMTLENNGNKFVVVLMGRKGMSIGESINALRASAEFVAVSVGAQLGECRPATPEDFPKGKKDIN